MGQTRYNARAPKSKDFVVSEDGEKTKGVTALKIVSISKN